MVVHCRCRRDERDEDSLKFTVTRTDTGEKTISFQPSTESCVLDCMTSRALLCSETDDVRSEIAKIQNLSPLIAMKNWRNTIKGGWIQHNLYQGKILFKNTPVSVMWWVAQLNWTVYDSQVNFRMIERKDVDD